MKAQFISKNLSVIFVLSLAFALLAACSARAPTAAPRNGPPTSAPATSAPTSAPPTTVRPTLVPTPQGSVPSIAEFPNLGDADTAGEAQPAGEYKTPAHFSIPFQFKTTKLYRGIYEGFSSAQIFGIAQGSANVPPKMLLFWAVDPSYPVEQVISELAASDNMTSTVRQAGSVAGIAGTQFDATAEQILAIGVLGKFVGHSGDDWHTNSSKVHLRFIAVPVAGRTLLIYIEAPQEEFDSFIRDANQVLDTVKFAK